MAQEQDKDPYEELAGRAEHGELIPDGSRALYGDAARESARKILFAAAGVSSWEELERQELTRPHRLTPARQTTPPTVSTDGVSWPGVLP